MRPPDSDREKSVQTLQTEVDRCGRLGIPYLVTHLGHHLGDGIAGGRARVIKAVNMALEASDNNVMLLLENTAGEKNSVGSSFEHIRAIIDGIEKTRPYWYLLRYMPCVCCRLWLRTGAGLAATLAQLDETVGINRLKVVHANDTKGDLGSGLDRHEHIGIGFIGEDGFRRILHHPAFARLPLICETPVDDREG